jgi:hypothetical protein
MLFILTDKVLPAIKRNATREKYLKKLAYLNKLSKGKFLNRIFHRGNESPKETNRQIIPNINIIYKVPRCFLNIP